jgi:streptomycin 6-kinase
MKALYKHRRRVGPDEVALRRSMKQHKDTSRGRDIFAIETGEGGFNLLFIIDNLLLVKTAGAGMPSPFRRGPSP